MIVVATQSFDHDRQKVRRGETINITSATARELRARGLVTFGGNPADPLAQTAGEPSSASQAAPAAPQTTSPESDAGEPRPKRRKKAAAE